MKNKIEKITGKLTMLVLTILLISLQSTYVKASQANMTQEEIISQQSDSLGIAEFMKGSKEYTKEAYGDIDINQIFKDALTGKVDNQTILKKVLSLLAKEFVGAITTLASIIVIIIIHSMLKSITDGLENKSISKVVYYVQYILIVTIIMKNFADIISMVKDSVGNMMAFMNSLIPILMTLLVTTGNITSSGMLQPALLFMITFLGNFITTIIIPVVLISTALGIISKISDHIQIDKITAFLKSATTWVLGIILTLFVTVLSLEGSLTSSVDGITAKTTKQAVSTVIPVVGKILGDAVDAVLGCSAIIKNAVGIVGIIIIIGICILPVIKLATLTIVYYLGSALCQPIADSKIIKLLDEMGSTFKMLLGIMCAISVMLIIGVTLVIKISDSGLMYR